MVLLPGITPINPGTFCNPHPVIKDILETVHGDSHLGFVRLYDGISALWYIRELARYPRDYLKHCPGCQIYQTRRHPVYGFLRLILTPLAVPFD